MRKFSWRHVLAWLHSAEQLGWSLPPHMQRQLCCLKGNTKWPFPTGNSAAFSLVLRTLSCAQFRHVRKKIQKGLLTKQTDSNWGLVWQSVSIFLGWKAVSRIWRHICTKLWQANCIRQKWLKTTVNVEFVIGPYWSLSPTWRLAKTLLSGVLVPPKVFEHIHINRRHWMAHVSNWHREFEVVSSNFWEKICMAYVH